MIEICWKDTGDVSDIPCSIFDTSKQHKITTDSCEIGGLIILKFLRQYLIANQKFPPFQPQLSVSVYLTYILALSIPSSLLKILQICAVSLL